MADNGELHTSAYWRDRADEARAKAAQMRSPDAEQSLLAIAQIYEVMADRAAKREARQAADAAAAKGDALVRPTRG